jgi:hypothetical protein
LCLVGEVELLLGDMLLVLGLGDPLGDDRRVGGDCPSNGVTE